MCIKFDVDAHVSDMLIRVRNAWWRRKKKNCETEDGAHYRLISR